VRNRGEQREVLGDEITKNNTDSAMNEFFYAIAA
jgi:hypothetical protein